MSENDAATNSPVTVSMATDDVAVLSMDLPGSGANILNETLFSALDQTMESLAERTDLAGVILMSAKPKIFVAGADLNQIVANLDWPDREIIKFCEKGRAVMARFSRCPFVSVAAIHGACVGGGLELALWCDCRIATDDRRTVLGLPEVKLGLVPGWAGTARLPRIAGLEVAAELITSGRLVSAAEAAEMKFIDEVASQEHLLDAAVRMVHRVRTSESFIRDRKAIMGSVPGIDASNPEQAVAAVRNIVTQVGEAIVNHREVYPYAPTVVLEHMTRTAAMDIKQAWDSESIAMAQVWGSPASRGLLNHFFLVDRNKKSPGLVDMNLQATPLDTIGIVGAGLMGQSIAANCLAAGKSVILLDANPQIARDAVDMLNRESRKSQATLAENYGSLEPCDLVIESVVETLDVKKRVLQQIEAAVKRQCLIGSNTSAIPIGKLAESLSHADRFCGVHFCHPELMSLVEVVCGPDSSETTIVSIVRWIQGLRKMPVAINDGPGFVVNRILAAMLDQALRLYQSGVTIKQIDHAMREFGFLGGPFEIVDVVGVETCMYAGRTMWEAGLQCVSLSPILPRLVKNGHLGRKSGAGFYQYAELGGDAQLDPSVDELLDAYRAHPTERVESIDDREIVLQVNSAMAQEATRLLSEAMVADHRDIDLCVIHGFSFPQHQGGILFWADQLGWTDIRQSLYKIGDEDPRWLPNEMVRQLAEDNGTVYEA